jgi:hypothetical protein
LGGHFVNSLIWQLPLPLLLQYSTDAIPSQEVPFSSVPVFFAHDFEGFNSGIDIFDDNSLIRQLPIQCLNVLSVVRINSPFDKIDIDAPKSFLVKSLRLAIPNFSGGKQ